MNRATLRDNKYLWYLFACLLLALPLFGHLDEPPIQQWDELRNAQNALEMNQTGQLLVTTFDFRPETWNTKPPLMIWMLALSQKIFGYNELAVRLPSAVAAALTCLFLLGFLRRRTGSWWPGILAILVLVTTKGYVTLHGARTGDFDALLTLFSTVSALAFVNFIEEDDRRWLWTSIVSLTLSCLTKGVAGLLICPAMLAYAVFRNKLRTLIKTRDLYLGMTFFLAIIGGYYTLREHYQPGYLQLVWTNELGGRYGDAIESHQGDTYTYYRELNNTGFSFWIPFLVPGLFAGFFSKDPGIRRVITGSAMFALSIFLIINFAATKLPWYLLPLYPFAAIICGLSIYQGLQLIASWEAPKKIWTFNFLPALVLLMLAFWPYTAILDNTLGGGYPKPSAAVDEAGIYLKEVISKNRELKANVLCGDAYPLHWYWAVINNQGKKFSEKGPRDLDSGMVAMVWEQNIKNDIEAHYLIEPIDSFHSVTIFNIRGKKPGLGIKG